MFWVYLSDWCCLVNYWHPPVKQGTLHHRKPTVSRYRPTLSSLLCLCISVRPSAVLFAMQHSHTCPLVQNRVKNDMIIWAFLFFLLLCRTVPVILALLLLTKKKKKKSCLHGHLTTYLDILLHLDLSISLLCVQNIALVLKSAGVRSPCACVFPLLQPHYLPEIPFSPHSSLKDVSQLALMLSVPHHQSLWACCMCSPVQQTLGITWPHREEHQHDQFDPKLRKLCSIRPQTTRLQGISGCVQVSGCSAESE